MPRGHQAQTRRFRCLSAEFAADCALVLADLDGCLVSDGCAYPDAIAFVEACKDRLWIISNNSTHTAESMSAELAFLGLQVGAERILLAGEQTLLCLRDQSPGMTVALYASRRLRAQAQAFGLRIDMDNPDVVILCRDLAFTIRDLEHVIAQYLRGASLWVSNTDCAHPGLDGRPVPETGALLGALRAVIGDVAFDCIGKPHMHMAQLALTMSRIAPQDTVFVGDNAATDGAFAEAAGIPFVHLVRGQAA